MERLDIGSLGIIEEHVENGMTTGYRNRGLETLGEKVNEIVTLLNKKFNLED